MTKSKYSCPICGQHNMGFYAITYRTHPFIDGKTYPRMCFGCSHVPEEFQQKYDSKGNIGEELGPFFDHKHLATAQELYQQGSTESLSEAQKCVAGVRQKIKEAGGAAKLNRLKLKRPKNEYDCEEWGTDKIEKKQPRKKRVSSKKVVEEEPVRKGPKKRAVPKKATKKKFGAKKPKKKSP